MQKKIVLTFFQKKPKYLAEDAENAHPFGRIWGVLRGGLNNTSSPQGKLCGVVLRIVMWFCGADV